MTGPRIREAGDAALLIELEPVIDAQVNARAVAIARVVRGAILAGVRDVVPTYRSVAVYFDPLVTDVAALESLLRVSGGASAALEQGAARDVPVVYGGESGPDLPVVAAFAGLSEKEVIERHADRVYRVFMLGFQPGFPFMGTVDAQIAAPRRPTPRVRVPAGSVGIAGAQTGIYPSESPGGWQIIGWTPLALFDPQRSPAALFAPGDAVRFVPADSRIRQEATGGPVLSDRPAVSRAAPDRYAAGRSVTVLRPGMLTTVQDSGRWGHQAIGVPVGGPLDSVSHRVANALLGNTRDAATLEVTVVGPELRLDQDTRLAVAGADLGAAIDGANVPLNQMVIAREGSVIRFGERRAGARAYVAFDGGVSVRAVLGSRATHLLSAIGGLHGRALAAGDRLPIGTPLSESFGEGGKGRPYRESRLRGAAHWSEAPTVAVAGGARLRVLPGPQNDEFPDTALDVLQSTRFVVAPQSDRMGYRLTGGRVPPYEGRGMISMPTFTGGVQVPPSGEPILLMADRQTIGGYPQIATVITADHAAAGQLAPGDWVEFQVCSRREAITALVALEGRLLAIG